MIGYDKKPPLPPTPEPTTGPDYNDLVNVAEYPLDGGNEDVCW